MEADIDDILTYELDETEYGDDQNCLSKYEYQSIRALGDRHLLFEGKNGKQWVNVLRGRCRGLSDNSIFIMKQNMAGRTCDKDQFEVVARSSSLTGPGAGMGPTCVLGEFMPVAKMQVDEIKARLETR